MNAMAFVPAPNIVEVEWRALRFGQHIENRVMVDMLAVPNLGTMNTLADEVITWLTDHYSHIIDAAVQFTELVLTDQSTITGLQITRDITGITGAFAGAPKPNAVSLCMSLRSGRRGRSARGRMYLLGLSQDMFIDANNVSGPFATLAITAVQALVNALATAGTPLVIVSYRTGNAPRPGGPVYFVVEGVQLVDNVVDSQKRRKPGVGI
jgi:hypothetical protein